MKCGLSDIHVAHVMLIGLPMQYQPSMTLESLNQDLTPDYVRQKIQNFQLFSDLGSNSAMLSRVNGGQRAGQNNAQGRACFVCGGLDHWKRDCKKATNQKHQGQQGGKQNNNEKQNNGKKQQGKKSKEKANLANGSGVSEGDRISVANGQSIPAKGIGNVNLDLSTGRTDVKDVLLVPGLSSKLLSGASMVDKGLTVTFQKNGCTVMDDERVKLLTARRVGGLFQVDLTESTSECCKLLFAKVSPCNQDLWHRRLGHLSITSMKQIHTANSKGLIPEEVWTGKPVSLDHLRVFGSTAVVLVPKEKRKKLEEKAQKLIFIGY
ncbi:hypothetical protein ONE63_008188 [Megalurothrips usitatus]|uniref:CCHC-type domain-containing protein n=1 Tax=Megalurothrips usitatus TaxID=439358 RepID=A0AAV7XLD5_9NEOP|nr:hypothetical protein ONE63_008188 [Megalurothrips usitatus]